MTQIDDGQAAAITGGKADALTLGLGGVTAKTIRPVTDATVPVFVSGVAQQISTNNDVGVYINIVTAAALSIAIGPTSSTTVVLSPSQVSSIGLIKVRVPRGWFIKLTGTMANLSFNAVAFGGYIA